jgi:hypothetical protein
VDNLIHDVPGPAFYISSANAVVFDRNTLQNTNYQTTDNKWNGAGDINSSIVINDASNRLLSRNSIHPAAEVKPSISVDAGTTTGIKIFSVDSMAGLIPFDRSNLHWPTISPDWLLARIRQNWEYRFGRTYRAVKYPVGRPT